MLGLRGQHLAAPRNNNSNYYYYFYYFMALGIKLKILHFPCRHLCHWDISLAHCSKILKAPYYRAAKIQHNNMGLWDNFQKQLSSSLTQVPLEVLGGREDSIWNNKGLNLRQWRLDACIPHSPDPITQISSLQRTLPRHPTRARKHAHSWTSVLHTALVITW